MAFVEKEICWHDQKERDKKEPQIQVNLRLFAVWKLEFKLLYF